MKHISKPDFPQGIFYEFPYILKVFVISYDIYLQSKVSELTQVSILTQ